jgi:hypothetical protein
MDGVGLGLGNTGPVQWVDGWTVGNGQVKEVMDQDQDGRMGMGFSRLHLSC